MTYYHAVIAYGKYYPAGAEVPEENQIVDAPAESISPEIEEKPKSTRKSSQEKSE